jgi:hypothetical protein
MAIDVNKANAFEIDPEQIDAERYATTPLLPPLMVNCRSNDLPASSPLQSPAVADALQSVAATHGPIFGYPAYDARRPK